MKKNQQIVIDGTQININRTNDGDYVCLTDIVRDIDGEGHIRNWMRNRNTIEFLGVWEQLNNHNFKPAGFDRFKKEVGLNSYSRSHAVRGNEEILVRKY